MELDVFDTYVTHQDGQRMHFDALFPKGSTQEQAQNSAMKWLKGIGMQVEGIQLDSCRFCHSESAYPEIEQTVTAKGVAILQMEGCPAPIH